MARGEYTRMLISGSQRILQLPKIVVDAFVCLNKLVHIGAKLGKLRFQLFDIAPNGRDDLLHRHQLTPLTPPRIRDR